MRHVHLILLVLALAAPARAQVDAETDAEARAASLKAATGASNSSTVKAAPSLTLEGSKDDKIVRGQIGFQYRAFTLTVGAKTPVGKDSDSSSSFTLADLDGLRNKTSGEVNAYVSRWIGATDPNPVIGPICDEYAETTGKTEGKDFKCRLGWFKKDSSDAGKQAYQAIIDKIAAPTILFAGANGSVAPEQFTFVGKTDLVKAEEKHTSWSFGGVVGVAFRTNTVLAGSFRREVNYKAQDTVQLCSPVGTTGSSSCTAQVLGAPGDPKKKSVASFEFKQFFGVSFAVAPKINIDTTNSVTGIEVPIYVLQDKSAGGLNGGITLGWTSDKKAFTASAFIGPVLRLITKT